MPENVNIPGVFSSETYIFFISMLILRNYNNCFQSFNLHFAINFSSGRYPLSEAFSRHFPTLNVLFLFFSFKIIYLHVFFIIIIMACGNDPRVDEK